MGEEVLLIPMDGMIAVGVEQLPDTKEMEGRILREVSEELGVR